MNTSEQTNIYFNCYNKKYQEKSIFIIAFLIFRQTTRLNLLLLLFLLLLLVSIKNTELPVQSDCKHDGITLSTQRDWTVL